MNKRIIIVCNGTLYDSLIGEIHADDYVIGVDRAAYWLLTHDVTPDLAIGDFDSVNESEMSHISSRIADTRRYPSEKSFTDTELAFQAAVEKNPKEIVVLGGSGTRMDHELATLSLLEHGVKRHIQVVFKNETNEIRLTSRGRTILEKRGAFRYVSLIPYTQKIVVTLEKFKYPLHKATIVRGQTIGISNEFLTSDATVTIHSGMALVIQSKD